MTMEVLQPKRAKRSTAAILLKSRFANYFGKFLLAIVPALLSYVAAKSEALSSAKSQAKVQSQQVETKAEAGYLELVIAAKHLDEESKTIRIYIGKLESRIEVLEQKIARLRGERVRPTSVGEGLRMEANEDQEPLTLPQDLDTAAEKHGQ